VALKKKKKHPNLIGSKGSEKGARQMGDPSTNLRLGQNGRKKKNPQQLREERGGTWPTGNDQSSLEKTESGKKEA